MTGNAAPLTSINWSGGFIYGAELYTNDTSPQRKTLRLSASYMPYEGLYILRTNSATGLITSVVFDQFHITGGGVSPAAADLHVTVKAPAALGSGFFKDRMEFLTCFDRDCNLPVPNGAFTLDVDFMVTVTEGVEFQRRSLAPSNGATSVVWSPVDQSLYVNASAFSSLPAQLLRIDPQTMATGATAAIPGETLMRMAVTTDGSYLYVGSKTRPFAYRYSLPGLTQDLSVPLGSVSPSTPYIVNDFAMIPGQPQSFVAALMRNVQHNAGVYIYDNATPRPVSVQSAPGQSFEAERWLVPEIAPGTFVSLNYGPSQPVHNSFDVLAISPNGISTIASTPNAGAGGVVYWGKPHRVGPRLYTPDAKVVDSASGALLATIALGHSFQPRAVLPDEANNRVYVWTEQRNRDVVMSFDMTTLQLLAIARVYELSGTVAGPNASMVLWGNEGVALVDGTRLTVLSGRFFSTYRGAPTM